MCANPDSNDCQKLQLGLGSRHSGGTEGVFCDGHVQFFEQEIDAKVWSDYGSRASQTLYQDGADRR